MVAEIMSERGKPIAEQQIKALQEHVDNLTYRLIVVEESLEEVKKKLTRE